MGFEGNLPIFIKNVMANRQFQVRVGPSLSDSFEQEQGVPQGSVLSPIHFGIQINSITKTLQDDVNCSLYVDDFVVCYRASSIPTIERQLQLQLNAFQKWADTNGFKFSPQKTIAVHFCNKKFYRDPDLYIGRGQRIPVEEEAKFLGVIFDKKLSFIPHLKYLKKKCQKALNLIKTLSGTEWGADRESLLYLYRSLIRSKLDYGSVVYGSARPSYIKMLDTIHHQGLRLSLGAFRTTPVESLYVAADEPSLSERRDKLSLQYAVNLKSHPDNPAFHPVFHPTYVEKFQSSPNAIPPFGIRVHTLFNLLKKKNFRKSLPGRWKDQEAFLTWQLSIRTKPLQRMMGPLEFSLHPMVFLRLVVISTLYRQGHTQCRSTDEVCEFWLRLEHRLPMMRGREAVYAHVGQLYMWDDDTASQPINASEIITADGWENARLVIAANGSIPGPPIESNSSKQNIVSAMSKRVVRTDNVKKRASPYPFPGPVVRTDNVKKRASPYPFPGPAPLRRFRHVAWAAWFIASLRSMLTKKDGARPSSVFLFGIILKEMVAALHRIYLNPNGNVYPVMQDVIGSNAQDLSQLLYRPGPSAEAVRGGRGGRGGGRDENAGLFQILQYVIENVIYHMTEIMDRLEFDGTGRTKNVGNLEAFILLVGVFLSRSMITTLLMRPVDYGLSSEALSETAERNLKVLATALLFIVRRVSVKRESPMLPMPGEVARYVFADEEMRPLHLRLRRTYEYCENLLREWGAEYIKRLRQAANVSTTAAAPGTSN
ncbi:hypothetical protein EGW08_019930 [Elysia chlorotica]|uniref:Reverse transcriptase domain-containing protein n=1 Tax=Elysia chlorotica TaxID=188477 RepID=A0A3S0ZDA1_ELYCH|nr:hypothetical protein EGW08_019930 [Elysia chlorotica]